MINKLTKDSILDEEVFDEIFSQEDEIYKAYADSSGQSQGAWRKEKI